MDFEQEKLLAEQRTYQQLFGRFAVSWGKWWHLNRHHFELGLVLKVVLLHLVTEAVRHKSAKPCSDRFWIMLVGMTGGLAQGSVQGGRGMLQRCGSCC